MKKLVLAIAAASAISSMASAEFVGTSSSGTISMAGEITVSACNLLPVEEIPLGSYTTRQMNALSVGQGTDWGTKNITFEGCTLTGTSGETPTPGVTAISFEVPAAGQGVGAGNAYWANGTQGADNIGVELQIGGQNVSALGATGANAISIPVADNTQTSISVPVRARMVKIADQDVTAGLFKRTLNFTATYK